LPKIYQNFHRFEDQLYLITKGAAEIVPLEERNTKSIGTQSRFGFLKWVDALGQR
jgi:hypothetical protein